MGHGVISREKKSHQEVRWSDTLQGISATPRDAHASSGVDTAGARGRRSSRILDTLMFRNGSRNPKIPMILWKFYCLRASPDHNVFTQLIKNDHKKVMRLFDDTPDPSGSLRSRYQRHLSMTHATVRHYFEWISFDNVPPDETIVMMLYGLGCYHSELGVTEEQLQAFVPSCIAGLRYAKKEVKATLTKSDEDHMEEVLRDIVKWMMVGFHWHHASKVYVDLILTNKGNHFKRMAWKRKCFSRPAAESWNQMEQVLRTK